MTTLVVTFADSYSQDRSRDRVYMITQTTSIGEILDVVCENTKDLTVVQRIAQRIVTERTVGTLSMGICCGPFQTRE